jgi:hypothetical protein
MKLSVRFGPFHFLGIVLGFEMHVALGSTKSKNLAVISHEGDSVSWIHRRSAEVALVYSHL